MSRLVLVQLVLTSCLVTFTLGMPPKEQEAMDYLQIARQVADRYMERRAQEQTRQGHSNTAVGSMRSFKRPSKRTQKLMEETERMNVEVQALELLAVGGDTESFHTRDLTLFSRASEDPFCDLSFDCTDTDNQNIVDGIEFRTADGMCNNEDNFSWGQAGIQHLRLVDEAYDNGRWNPRVDSVTGTNRDPVALPEARTISNNVHGYSGTTPNNADDISLAFFQWGQFLDHDVINTPEGSVGNADCCTENRAFCMPINIAAGDEYFTDGICMPAQRSFTVLACDDDSGFQNQINDITAYIDASNVYGSSVDESDSLRTFVGGFLKTSTNSFLPEDEDADACNEVGPNSENPGFCFHAGDGRVNAYPGLTTYHTVFMRLHNSIAAELGALNDWSDERLFQETRKIIGAIMQHITYTDFLPVILDSDAMADYGISGSYTYKDTVDASIFQAFSIAYRFGHSLIPDKLVFLRDFLNGTLGTTDDFTETDSVDTEDAFQEPSLLFEHSYLGAGEIGLGQVSSVCPHADRYMDDSARNKLFLDSDGISFDLAALNIDRGREWGTPAYTEFRNDCGISGTDGTDSDDWDNLGTTHDADTITVLSDVYADPRDVDLFTGIVTETPIGTSLAGKTLTCLLSKQFSNLKHGDRFFYDNENATTAPFTSDQVTEIKKTTLSKILCDALGIDKLPKDAFDSSSTVRQCSKLDSMDFSYWKVST